jgi:hypothetical protein
MTRRTSFPDLVTVRRRVPGAPDGRNNETFTDADTPLVPARIDTAAETEDIVDRDRATETLEVILPAFWIGESMALTAGDALVIADKVYELIGAADVGNDHAGRPQNVTIVCRRIVG